MREKFGTFYQFGRKLYKIVQYEISRTSALACCLKLLPRTASNFNINFIWLQESIDKLEKDRDKKKDVIQDKTVRMISRVYCYDSL